MRRKQTHQFPIVIERDEDGILVGSVPSLPGCHTQAKTLDQLMDRMREAIELYLDATKPEPPAVTEFVGVHQLTVAR